MGGSAGRPGSGDDGAARFERELAVAALRGWAALSVDHLHRLIAGAAGSGLLDRLMGQPGLLTDTDATGLHTGLLRHGGDRGRAWAHLLTAAGLPDQHLELYTPDGDTAAEVQADRLRVAAAGLPGGPSVDALAGSPADRPGPRLVPVWSSVRTTPAVALAGAGSMYPAVVAAVPMPDGTTLVAASHHDTSFRLWDPVTGQPVTPSVDTGHPPWLRGLTAVAVPGLGTLIATVGKDATLRFWDPTTTTAVGDPVRGCFPDPGDAVTVPVPGGAALVAAHDEGGTIRLWDPATGRPVSGALDQTAAVPEAVVPAPDGIDLTAGVGPDNALRLSDRVTGQPVGQSLTGRREPAFSLAAVPLPGGTVLLAGGDTDGTAVLWDLPAWRSTRVAAGHHLPVATLAAAPGPTGTTLLASGGHDDTVRLWEPTTGRPAGGPLSGHTGTVTSVVAVSGPDGSHLLATGGRDGSVRLWDLATGEPAGDPLASDLPPVGALTVVPGPDGPVLVGGADGTLHRWDLTTRRPLGDPLDAHTGPVVTTAAVPSTGGRTLLASGGQDGTVRLWDPATGAPAGGSLTDPHGRPVAAVTAVTAPDGRPLVASTSGWRVTVWDPATGRLVGPPLEAEADVSALAALPSPDGGTLVAGGAGRSVWLWDLATRRELCHHHLPGDVGAVAALPGGRLAVGHGNEVAVLRVTPAG